MHHELCTVAETEYRNAEIEKLLRAGRCSVLVAAVRTAGENYSLGIHRLDFGNVRLVRINLTIYVTFSDTARNELVVLTAKVYNYN